jgi:uncharacterized protein
MNNAINWFEIPATNFERSTRFYSTVLGVELNKTEFHQVPHAIFPSDDDGAGGAIVHRQDLLPNANGTMIYLNAKTEKALAEALGRVEKAGGKIAVPKTRIAPQGWMGAFLDPDGNRVGLHSPEGA